MSKIFTISFILFCAVVLILGLRGISGNPDAYTLNAPQWKDGGPFELSPERGRFALTYSLVEDKSFQFSVPMARFTAPDVAYVNGGYVSLFNPGVSFLAIPGYVIGRQFDLSQVGAFSIVALFALLNIILIRLIAIRLGANPLAANIGAAVFAFASPAFAYAATLYQHHISVFLILLGIYALIRWNNLWSVALVWFLIAFSVVVDNPNIFFMIPLGIYALARIIWVEKEKLRLKVNINLLGILTFFAIVPSALLFLWFNQASTDNPLQLPGTLPAIEAIDEKGLPTQSEISKLLNLQAVSQKEKTAVGFFKTRNLLNGFYIHSISPDRGILWFTPIMLLGILGFVYLYKTNRPVANLIMATIGFNIILYSLWGDPWGGWAFGSRYLIPSYALGGIGLSLALTKFRKNYLFIILFIILSSYSVWVNTLGAITSDTNPPQAQILSLEEVSGREEKFTYERNLDLLKSNKSKSFIFQKYASRYMNAQQYHQVMTTLIIAMILSLMVSLFLLKNDHK